MLDGTRMNALSPTYEYVNDWAARNLPRQLYLTFAYGRMRGDDAILYFVTGDGLPRKQVQFKWAERDLPHTLARICVEAP